MRNRAVHFRHLLIQHCPRVTFPALGAALGLSNEGFGLFAGTAINDTSSVTAAAAAWDGLYGSNTLRSPPLLS